MTDSGSRCAVVSAKLTVIDACLHIQRNGVADDGKILIIDGERRIGCPGRAGEGGGQEETAGEFVHKGRGLELYPTMTQREGEARVLLANILRDC